MMRGLGSWGGSKDGCEISRPMQDAFDDDVRLVVAIENEVLRVAVERKPPPANEIGMKIGDGDPDIWELLQSQTGSAEGGKEAIGN
jgi:hypothetical protein